MVVNETIDEALAQQIVDATRQVVDKDINFISQDGIIIASTNPKRIGTFHEAGHLAFTTGQVIKVEQNSDYAGAKQGVNYPIVIDDHVHGVIGITGNPVEVLKYGFLASKITEVFIKEKQMTSHYESRKQMIRYLMGTFMMERKNEPKELEEVLNKLEINPINKYYCVVLELDKQNIDLMRIQNKIHHMLKAYQIELYAYTYPNQFTLLVSERLFNTVDTMKHVLIQEYEKALHCGVGEIKSLFEMSDSYQSALIALKYAKQTDSVYLNFKNLDFQLIAEELSLETKRRYIEKMIGELDEEDIEFLKHYYICNLSLKECAESMFIHKNTVQYRLDKIYRKTGLNPRVFKESALIYLAISLKSDTGMSLITKNK